MYQEIPCLNPGVPVISCHLYRTVHSFRSASASRFRWMHPKASEDLLGETAPPNRLSGRPAGRNA